MRQIVLDTETTGMPASGGHRIIEIGCVELIDRQLSGNVYHQYLNPERLVDAGAFNVHGISDEFLSDKPVMATVIDEFLSFIDGAELIIHNAKFDLGFLNHELQLLTREGTIEERCQVIDTLQLAREKHPGARASLDALTKRYAISQFDRQWHGALLDAQILAQVYLAMTGGQSGLEFSAAQPASLANNSALSAVNTAIESADLASVSVSEEERLADQNYFNQS